MKKIIFANKKESSPTIKKIITAAPPPSIKAASKEPPKIEEIKNIEPVKEEKKVIPAKVERPINIIREAIPPTKKEDTIEKASDAPKKNEKQIVLNTDGVNLLIETIISELSKQFIRRDEVVEVVTKALQKMVMEDIRPDKEKKLTSKYESKPLEMPNHTIETESDDDWGMMQVTKRK